MRKLLSGLALIAATASQGLANLPQNSTPLKKVDNLVVNTSRDYRTYSTKSEAEGISDLRALVHTADLEEAWAYIPRIQTWVEIGQQETRQGGSYSVNVDMDYFESLTRQFPEVVVYHFHPKGSVIFNGLPSIRDIDSLVDFVYAAYSDFVDCDITAGVVSQFGVSLYSYNENYWPLEEIFAQIDGQRFFRGIFSPPLIRQYESAMTENCSGPFHFDTDEEGAKELAKCGDIVLDEVRITFIPY